MATDQKQIIMNFTVPPGTDELVVIAQNAMDHLPEELMEFCDSLVLHIEDLADETIEHELDLDDPFELMALYRSGSEISPGVKKKIANDDDVLVLYRRPILDLWCESCDDINNIVRHVMIEELGQNFDFSDEEIEEMTERHYQGML